jgi:hypothetical protein
MSASESPRGDFCMKAQPKPIDAAELAYSDNECVQRLAALIEYKDTRSLAEISKLISRLAIPIEFAI